MNIGRGVEAVVSDLWSDDLKWILVALSVGQLLSIGIRVVFPALLPDIRAEFLLTNTTAGILLSVLWIGFATAQLPGGILGDRVGERNALVTSVGLATLGLVVIVLSPNLPLFALGLALFGIGTGLYATPRITVLSDVYPDRAAAAISVNEAVGNAGNAVLPVLATVIAAWFSWRTGIGMALPAFVLLAAGLWIVIPFRTSPGMETDDEEPRREAVRRVLLAATRKPVLIATGGMILLGFVWQGFTAFLPTYLVDVKGISQSTAAVALGTFFLAGSVLQPIFGSIADRYDERPILIGVSAVTAVGLAGFPFADSIAAFLALSVLASFQLAFWPIIFAYIPRALPDNVQGSGFGLLRAVFLYAGATGPIVVGSLADFDLFDESFLLLAGLAGIALVLSAILPDVED